MEEAMVIQREATSHLEVIAAATAAGQLRVQQGFKGVQGFYAGGVVFITGASGYMGKHLLEKLFRSCEMRKAYLLLREKKSKPIEDRLNDILKDPAFDSLHKTQPDFKQRIVPVEGDVGEKNLGLSQDNWKDLTENVTMIFHVAATVKFDEALKIAALTNVRGTRDILHLARKCTQLKSFVYVSTAYSNVIKSRAGSVIEEQFYPVPVSPEYLIHMAETFSKDRIEEMTPGITQGWPNTYSFTKALAEDLVRTAGSGLPVCIVRPAIVIGAYREPLPGWLDKRCVHGPAGIGLSLIMGVNHVVRAVPRVSANLVPVDYVNNAVLVAGTACDRAEIVIYNVSCDRSFRWAHCLSIFREKLSQFPSPKIIGDGFAFSAGSDVAYRVLALFLHYIPAWVVDVGCVLAWKKPWMVQIYKRMDKISNLLCYFTCNNWIFNDKNTQSLYQSLSDTDKCIFNFDVKNLDVTKMMVLWALGLRKFVLNDELKGNDVGRRKKIVFKLITVGFFLLYVTVFIWMLKHFFALF